MKNLNPIAYRTLFFKHVWRFIERVATKQEIQSSHAVAVSGGPDSMALLWVACRLYNEGKIGPVRAIFVHHHTREGQKGDGDLVQKFCAQENIPFTMLHVEGLSSVSSNFEAKARRLRRELCIQNLKSNELLWVGHHLDDSYEWNFMQRYRSTSPKSSLGIPVRNRAIIRPFLCVTRKQIEKMAEFEGIPSRQDPTNLDLKHDRNFVRHKITPLIKSRYPKYLKFYSHFANFSAMMLNVSILDRRKGSSLYAYQDGAIILGRHFSEVQIQELIHNYSMADRGALITPIQRMLYAIDNKKKGPFHFSGGIHAYHSHNLLMIYRQGMTNYDGAIAEVLTKLSKSELEMMPPYSKIELEQSWQNLLKSQDTLMNMPGLILVAESDSICKTMNTSVYDALFPRVSALCKEKGLRFITFQKCLDVWTQKREKLPEKLRLIPLYNLSNLYASQE